MSKSIRNATFTVAALAAIGVWAITSLFDEAQSSVPGAITSNYMPSVTELTLMTRDLPVQQFDAF